MSEVHGALELILSRHAHLKPKVGFRGDFGERAFRFWLVLDVLMPVYGWRHERVVAGEVYDLLLLDRREQCVVAIETKNPGHVPTKEDIRAFEGRLHHFPTLQWAFFTDGRIWRRLRLSAPVGRQTIIGDETARLGDGLSLQALLDPLYAKGY